VCFIQAPVRWPQDGLPRHRFLTVFFIRDLILGEKRHQTILNSFVRTRMTAPRAIAELKGRLVVSVQADEDSPLRSTPFISALAQCALVGGAAGLRIEGMSDVAAVRAITDKPIVGLTKAYLPGEAVYITPSAANACDLVAAGADIVAIDATARRRPESFAAIAAAAHAAGASVLADVATFAEARNALQEGADIVATTLAGYMGGIVPEEPDFAFMRQMGRAGLCFAAEGRIRSPKEAAQAIAIGASFVIVGSAITRPDVVTSWFASAIARARNSAKGAHQI
jgi:N-acylglucosamine-6-phosphate 2-epimerase